MDLHIIDIENTRIAKPVSKDTVISTVRDATDLMANADYQGARNIILEEGNLDPVFFDLKTGMAGEVLQKYSNYHMKLAIVGEFGKFCSAALNAFIIECNRGNSVFFVPDFDAAVKKMVKGS